MYSQLNIYTLEVSIVSAVYMCVTVSMCAIKQNKKFALRSIFDAEMHADDIPWEGKDALYIWLSGNTPEFTSTRLVARGCGAFAAPRHNSLLFQRDPSNESVDSSSVVTYAPNQAKS